MEKLLPIGSIVCLKKGKQKLMIVCRGMHIEHEEQIQMFDYSAYVYPLGLMPNNEIYHFNAENIDKVIFEGYSDEDEIKLQKAYSEWLEANKDEVVKGKVINPLSEN